MKNLKQNDVLSFLAHNAVVEVNHHHCFQIIVSTKDAFHCTINEEELELKGIIINQAVPHNCRVLNTSVIVYYIDSDGFKGKQLKALLDGKPYLKIEKLLSENDLENLNFISSQMPSLQVFNIISDNLLDKMLPSKKEAEKELDKRIVKTIDFIEKNIQKSLNLEVISNEIHLSPERIRHLFTTEIGMPFSQYLLWKKIKHVMADVLKGDKTMVEASNFYGFTDQAHFSKHFKRMFGVAAKSMLKPNPYIQFLSSEIYI